MVAGLGADFLIKKLQNFSQIKKYRLLEIIQIVILAILILGVKDYTKREKWMASKLDFKEQKIVALPGSPANRHLHPDDLKIFSRWQNVNFLSYPWKGAAIGTLTHNFPFCLKSGTISFNKDLYQEFMKADCQQKYLIAKDHWLDYVYTPAFQCPYFSYVEESAEGIVLYAIK